MRLSSRSPIALQVDFECAAGELVALVGPSGSGKTTVLRSVAGLHRASDMQGQISVGGQLWFKAAQGTGPSPPHASDGSVPAFGLGSALGAKSASIYLPPQARRVGMVFQQYALFPHLTALHNIAINDDMALTPGKFSVNSTQNSHSASTQQLAALMARLGLADLAQRLPGQLSGGQQQRVALARALWRLTTQGWGALAAGTSIAGTGRLEESAIYSENMRSPNARTDSAASRPAQQGAPENSHSAAQAGVLLLDEPFSAVDAPTRQALYTELASLRQHIAVPMVLVTHDLAEARRLADRVVIIDAGQSLQSGTPAQVFGSPRNARVAQLVGIQNHFSGVFYRNVSVQRSFVATDNEAPAASALGLLQWGNTRLQVADKGKIADNTAVTWVLAAQHIEISRAGAGHKEGAGAQDARAGLGAGLAVDAKMDGEKPTPNRLRCTLVQRLELGEMCVCQLRVDTTHQADRAGTAHAAQAAQPTQASSQVLNLNLSTSFLRALQADVGTPLDVLIPPEAVHIMPLKT